MEALSAMLGLPEGNEPLFSPKRTAGRRLGAEGPRGYLARQGLVEETEEPVSLTTCAHLHCFPGPGHFWAF